MSIFSIRKFAVFVYFVFIVLLIFSKTSYASPEPALITVCPDNCQYTSIQTAIDAANPGDMIEVQSGTYPENVDIYKQLTLRGADTGGGKPVMGAGINDPAITLEANGITLEGFIVISGCGCDMPFGIPGGAIQVSSNDNIIADNIISNARYGSISLFFSNNNTIKNNLVSNGAMGIGLAYSSNNTIVNNVVYLNHYGGIVLKQSNNNIIYQNNIINNAGDNVYDEDLYNQWDNGTIGNHNSNFDEPVEGCFDYDGDNICDSSYTILDSPNVDRYPLVSLGLPAEPILTFVTISPSAEEISEIAAGSTVYFVATPKDQFGNAMAVPVVWGSSNEEVGVVDQSGFFTAQAAGTTTIKATAGTIEGSVSVTVTSSSFLTSITVSPSHVFLSAGEMQQFIAIGYDADGNTIPITPNWVSSNTAVGTINSNGLFTAESVGETTVTAESGGIIDDASVIVSLGPAHITAVSVTPKNPKFRQKYTININLYNPNSIPQAYKVVLKNDTYTKCSSFDSGSHTVSAYGTSSYNFACTTNWTWIPERGWLSLLIDEAMLLSNFPDYIDAAFSALEVYSSLGSWFKKEDNNTYFVALSYESTPDIKFDISDSDRKILVKVQDLKKILLGSSVGFGVASTIATMVGMSMISKDPKVKVPLLITEAAGKFLSWSLYQIAYDPDFNYTTIQEPIPLYLPELDSLPEGDAKNFASKYAEFASLRNATFTAYIRYDGARIDDQPEYMLLQLNAANNYTIIAMKKLDEVKKYYGLLTSSMLPLTDEQIQQIREEIQSNGLPQIEVDVLTRNGLGDSIGNLTEMVLNVSPELYRDPKNYAKYLDVYAMDLSNESAEYVSDIIRIKVEQQGYNITTASGADIADLENLKNQIQARLNQGRATPALAVQINEMIGNSLRVLDETNNRTYASYFDFSVNALAIFQSLNKPPATTAVLSGTVGDNGWHLSDVQVNLTAIDPDGPFDIIRTEYSLDNSTWVLYAAPFNISSEGMIILYYRSIDDAGNIEQTNNMTVKIDKTAPQIIFNVPANGSTYILNEDVLVNWSVTDTLSGISFYAGTKLTGETIATGIVGEKIFNISAVDKAGNYVDLIVKYRIVYNYSGIFQPINADGSSIFKLGRTVPIKFRLFDSENHPVGNATAKLYLSKIMDAISGNELEAVSTSAATTGNLFRYSADDNQYVFNLGTKGLTSGTWQLRIKFDDGLSKYVVLSLK